MANPSTVADAALRDKSLDQAGRAELSLREALAMLCTAEVARKDERRIQMGLSIAEFPYLSLGTIVPATAPIDGARKPVPGLKLRS